jgi:thermitase
VSRRVLSALVVAFGVVLVAVFFAARPGSNEPASVPKATATDSTGAADDPRHAKRAEVLVGFEPEASEEKRNRAAKGVDAERKETVFRGRGSYPRLELLKLPRGSSNSQAIRRLKQDPNVAYAEPNYIRTRAATSNDPYFADGNLWGMYGDGSPSAYQGPKNRFGSQAAEAWARGNTGGERVYVGVIDDGIDISHPELDGNAWTNPDDPVDGQDNDANGYVDDAHGWDFAHNDRSLFDGPSGGDDGHSTHVAGTLGAEGGNATGVAGVNWDVTYINAKIFGENGATSAGIIQAVDYFTNLKRRGVNVVATNNSWGGGWGSQAELDAINRGGDAGNLFVAAAGNNGRNIDGSPFYPASYRCTTGARNTDCVLSVAALRNDGALAKFSNYGRSNVDLAAPGQAIYSTLPSNGYASWNGTSMATPHVTGAAALYASSRPGATMGQVRSGILNSTTPTTSLSRKTVTGGRLNAGGF